MRTIMMKVKTRLLLVTIRLKMLQKGFRLPLRCIRASSILRSYHKKQRIGNPVTVLNQSEQDVKLNDEADYGFVPYLNKFKLISNSTAFETRYTDIDELHPSTSENKVSKADWIKDKIQHERQPGHQNAHKKQETKAKNKESDDVLRNKLEPIENRLYINKRESYPKKLENTNSTGSDKPNKAQLSSSSSSSSSSSAKPIAEKISRGSLNEDNFNVYFKEIKEGAAGERLKVTQKRKRSKYQKHT